VPEREESDQLPEEAPGGQVADDDESQGASRDDAEKQAGTPGEDGQDGDGQASGNPANAG
jgi:hypothetical protein